MRLAQVLTVVIVMLAVTSLTLTGCGGRRSKPKGTVEGKVTFQGQPYSNASIVFLSPDTGQGDSVNIQPDGSFRLSRPIEVGTYVVYLAPRADDDPMAEPKPVSIDKTVPDKYWSEATSDIRVEVKTGNNQFDIQLNP